MALQYLQMLIASGLFIGLLIMSVFLDYFKQKLSTPGVRPRLLIRMNLARDESVQPHQRRTRFLVLFASPSSGYRLPQRVDCFELRRWATTTDRLLGPDEKKA